MFERRLSLAKKYVLIKVKEGLMPGLKTYYYTWRGDNPPEDLLSLKPIKEDISPWINYIWWDRPSPGVPAEFFAVAWLGFIYIDKPGVYRFYVTTDDGSRVWLDNKLIINAWKDQPPTTYVSQPLPLREGYHKLKYYFYNRYAFAQAALGWIPPEGEPGVIPKERFYHSIGDKIFFTGIPDNYIVEVLPEETSRRRCVAHAGICGVSVSFDEMPLKALVRILSDNGEVVYESPVKLELWGGDEIKFAEVE